MQVQNIQQLTKNKATQSDPTGTCWGGQASNPSLQLDILSLWNPLANMFLGMIPNLILWQEGGLRAPIRCYLDSILPGRSGLFTPPQAWLSRPAHLQPEGPEVRHMQENRGQKGCGVDWRSLRMPLRFAIGAGRGHFGMTERSANLVGKAAQMCGWDGCWGRMQVMDGGC